MFFSELYLKRNKKVKGLPHDEDLDKLKCREEIPALI
jgi:hypothetical protein